MAMVMVSVTGFRVKVRVAGFRVKARVIGFRVVLRLEFRIKVRGLDIYTCSLCT